MNNSNKIGKNNNSNYRIIIICWTFLWPLSTSREQKQGSGEKKCGRFCFKHKPTKSSYSLCFHLCPTRYSSKNILFKIILKKIKVGKCYPSAQNLQWFSISFRIKANGDPMLSPSVPLSPLWNNLLLLSWPISPGPQWFYLRLLNHKAWELRPRLNSSLPSVLYSNVTFVEHPVLKCILPSSFHHHQTRHSLSFLVLDGTYQDKTYCQQIPLFLLHPFSLPSFLSPFLLFST